ncbi:MAG: hypothetical protein GEV00_00110 [Actinophytocola sp.]|nr:hypothetical protein [Actinophytocola sp.]
MPESARIDMLPWLRDARLIETLDVIDPIEFKRAEIGAVAVVRAVDPRKLDRVGVRRLLDALCRIAAVVPEADLGTVEPETFATLLAASSRAQLDAVVAAPPLREVLLAETFRRMAHHVRAERVRHLRAVARWRLTGGSGAGGYDRHGCRFADGACTVSTDVTGGERPRATITVSPVDFLRLTTRQATAAVLFVTGKLTVKGDLGFAAGLTRYLDLPAPRE